MGLSSSKTKTKTTNAATETASKTPTNPAFVTDAIKSFTDKTTAFGNTDPLQYVAPAAPLQNQAFTQATADLGAWKPATTAATGLITDAIARPLTKAQERQAARAQVAASKGANATTYAAPTVAGAQAQAHDAQFSSMLPTINDYMSPYNQQVVDTTLAGFDRQAGMQDAQETAAAARNGALGGSRFGIADAQTDSDNLYNRARLEAGLRDQAFGEAAGYASQEAQGRTGLSIFNAGNQTGVSGHNADLAASQHLTQAQLAAQAAQFGAASKNEANQFTAAQANQAQAQQAQIDAATEAQNAAAATQTSQFNAQLEAQQRQDQLAAAALQQQIANSTAANTHGDIALTADLGAQQHAINQAIALAPVAQLDQLGQLYSQAPLNLFNGFTGTGTSNSTTNTVQKQGMNLFQTLMAGAERAAGAAASGSDRRLKRDIEQIGNHGKLKLYTFNYHWDEPDRPKRTGVMADEVAVHAPEALGPKIAGYATVNYEKLGLAHLVEA